ncbi:hypothetical protein ACLKA6_002910 [Drosophila palustris]
MKSLWFLCLILAQLLPKETSSQNTKNNVNFCELKVMVFAGYLRTMCAPLQAIWVPSHGICRKAYTCTKGYTEDECKKNCLTKPKPKLELKLMPTAAAEKSMLDIVSEKTINMNQSSVRTRRPRRRTTPIPAASEEEV